MRVAFSSSNGRNVDIGFDQSCQFQIWDITLDGIQRCPCVDALVNHTSEEQNTIARLSAIAHCDLVCAMDIGENTMARLVNRGIHPLCTSHEIPIFELVEKLQTMLRTNRSPWLKRLNRKKNPSSQQPV
ncbi:NifB/NifX family molybdenum-iron cluster-binding protein [uncultured Desulfuromonas sp.]|uniref:NifB/NifX family molybdenum-iron cluster-binding protein n=1 Tax=uncultured Desulfuromonas sp. TaxID=181013 RepID=UPI002AAB7AF6|nr:NifB/NifX family molybdenum-iron cluster-binding protein [uncultured Desulfuromonas sp.]